MCKIDCCASHPICEFILVHDEVMAALHLLRVQSPGKSLVATLGEVCMYHCDSSQLHLGIKIQAV